MAIDTRQSHSYMARTRQLRAGLIHARGSVQEWKRRFAIFATIEWAAAGLPPMGVSRQAALLRRIWIRSRVTWISNPASGISSR